MIEIVPAQARHINRIANNMRPIDVLECAGLGLKPKTALRHGLMSSFLCWTGLLDGEPEAMFGVSTISLLENTGCPWLLLTNKGGLEHRALVRFGKIYTEALHKQYAMLHNHVHADNHRAIRWLSRLGYAVGPVDVLNGQPMRPFVLSSGGL